MSTTRIARALATLGLALGLGAGAAAQAQAGPLPPQPGPSQPHFTFGETGRAGNLAITMSYGNKLGEARLWEHRVTVCNRGSEAQAVGPDAFSYTTGNRVTRVYQPRSTYLAAPLRNQYLAAGRCVTGGLVESDGEPWQLAFTDVHTGKRYDILPATEWEGILQVGWPRAAGTSNHHGDYSNDAVADVVGMAGGKLLAYTTVSGPRLTAAGPTGAVGSFTWVGKAGDIDHNGATDLLLRDSTGTMWLQYLQGNHRAGFRTIVGYGFNSFPQLTVLDDVTGDGRPELVGRRWDGRLYRFGVGVPRLTGPTQIGQNWQPMRQLFSVGDLSGDGRADLLAVRSDGNLYRYAMTRTGSIGRGERLGHGWQSMRQAASPGDMDRDGRRDLVAVRSDGHLYFYANRSGGRFGQARQIGSNWNGVTALA